MVEKKIQLFGIFGHPLAHTLSPAMQEAAFSDLGTKAFYLVFDLELSYFRKAMSGLKRSQFALAGFNVTVPYKEAVLPYLASLTEEAQTIGAVNTIFRRGDRWCGANTDAYGFLKSLSEDAGFRPEGKKILLLGAGGSARAVVYALASRRAKLIQIVNRNPNRARTLVKSFKKKFPKTEFKIFPSPSPLPKGEGDFSRSPLPSGERNKVRGAFKRMIEESDLIVNATSVGLKKTDVSLIPSQLIPAAGKNRRKVFFDLIYRPATTQFLANARRKGHKTVNGIEMLLQQGAKSLEYWTEKKAPVEVMRRALARELASSKGDRL